jgi:hypothetical protein
MMKSRNQRMADMRAGQLPVDLVARPNPVLAPGHVYQAKTDRWRRQWPGLTVLPWPEGPVAT